MTRRQRRHRAHEWRAVQPRTLQSIWSQRYEPIEVAWGYRCAATCSIGRHSGSENSAILATEERELREKVAEPARDVTRAT